MDVIWYLISILIIGKGFGFGVYGNVYFEIWVKCFIRVKGVMLVFMYERGEIFIVYVWRLL